MRFIENHDEPRAAATFAAGGNGAAAVTTLDPDRRPARPRRPARGPEGPAAGLPRPLPRRADRPRAARRSTSTLLARSPTPSSAHGEWQLGELQRLGRQRQRREPRRLGLARRQSRKLVVVNLGDADATSATSRCPGTISAAGTGSSSTRPDGDDVYERSGDDLRDGLYVHSAPWAWHLFRRDTALTMARHACSTATGRCCGARAASPKATGRPEDDLFAANDWYRWGPYVSERQWGTVREDYSADGDAWDYLPARPRPLPRLPLGRGRPGRVLRRRAAAVPGAGAVERPRPDPQGADVRADRRRRATTARTSRSTGGTSTRSPATPGTAGATTTRRRAFPYEDLIDENGRRGKLRARVRAARHRRLRRRPLLDRRGALRQGRPDRPADDGSRSPTPGPEARHAARAADRSGSATPGRGTSARRRPRMRGDGDGVGRRRAPARSASSSCVAGAGPGRHRARRCCSATTRPTPQRLYGAAADHAVPEGRHQRPRRPRARRRSTPTGAGTKAPFWYRLTVAPGETVELRLRLRPAGDGAGRGDRARRRLRPGRGARGGPRPTSSTPS